MQQKMIDRSVQRTSASITIQTSLKNPLSKEKGHSAGELSPKRLCPLTHQYPIDVAHTLNVGMRSSFFQLHWILLMFSNRIWLNPEGANHCKKRILSYIQLARFVCCVMNPSLSNFRICPPCETLNCILVASSGRM